jgi:hypothetical protein
MPINQLALSDLQPYRPIWCFTLGYFTSPTILLLIPTRGQASLGVNLSRDGTSILLTLPSIMV